jgi:ribonuclease HI
VANDDVTLFCDGSCLGNPGPGGWAALLRTSHKGEKHEKLLSGGAAQTTNNRMELTAAIEGLRALKRPCSVLVVTDSNYVIKGMTEWVAGWIKRGWINSQKKPVENRPLWEQLLAAAAPHQVKYQWVKGHAGHPENELVDEAARRQAAKFQAGG